MMRDVKEFATFGAKRAAAALSIVAIGAGSAAAGPVVAQPAVGGGDAKVWFGADAPDASITLIDDGYRNRGGYGDSPENDDGYKFDDSARPYRGGVYNRGYYRGGRYYKDRRYGRRGYYYRDDRGRDVALGALGAIVGIAAAGAIAQQGSRGSAPAYQGSGECSYWADQCARNWGRNNNDFYGCLRYHGCN